MTRCQVCTQPQARCLCAGDSHGLRGSFWVQYTHTQVSTVTGVPRRNRVVPHRVCTQSPKCTTAELCALKTTQQCSAVSNWCPCNNCSCSVSAHSSLATKQTVSHRTVHGVLSTFASGTPCPFTTSAGKQKTHEPRANAESICHNLGHSGVQMQQQLGLHWSGSTPCMLCMYP